MIRPVSHGMGAGRELPRSRVRPVSTSNPRFHACPPRHQPMCVRASGVFWLHFVRCGSEANVDGCCGGRHAPAAKQRARRASTRYQKWRGSDFRGPRATSGRSGTLAAERQRSVPTAQLAQDAPEGRGCKGVGVSRGARTDTIATAIPLGSCMHVRTACGSYYKTCAHACRILHALVPPPRATHQVS